MQETLVRFLGQGVPWRRDRLPTPAFLPEELPRTEESGRLQFTGSQKSDTTDHILILVIVLIASTSNKIMKQPCKGLLIKMEKATITSTQSILNFPPKSYLRLMDVVICLMKSIISLSFEAFTQSRGKKS